MLQGLPDHSCVLCVEVLCVYLTNRAATLGIGTERGQKPINTYVVKLQSQPKGIWPATVPNATVVSKSTDPAVRRRR